MVPYVYSYVSLDFFKTLAIGGGKSACECFATFASFTYVALSVLLNSTYVYSQGVWYVGAEEPAIN